LILDAVWLGDSETERNNSQIEEVDASWRIQKLGNPRNNLPDEDLEERTQ